MRKLTCFVFIAALVLGVPMKGYPQDTWENHIVPTYMALQGVAIAGIWTKDLLSGKFEGGFFEAKENNLLLWPHVTAEYLTATGLMVGAYGLYKEKPWGRKVALVSLGALAYTSLNSLNWALAEKERLKYAVPMLMGLFGSTVSITILF